MFYYIIFTTILLLWAFIYFYAPKFIIEINNPIISIFKKPIPNKVFNPYNKDIKHLQLRFNSFDNTDLSFLLTYALNQNAKGTLLLLHGIRNSSQHFHSILEDLSIQGYNTVALDLRGHGLSEGKFCTFGVKEKKDVSSLLDILINELKLNNNIGIWGHSLGGAIGLQVMANDSRIKFGVIESTFSDFRVIVSEYSKQYIGFKFTLLSNFLVNRASSIADFDPSEAIPKISCSNINQPILLVHGNLDEKINIKYSTENFNNIRSNNKEYLTIFGASHQNVWEIGGEKYFKIVSNFIEQSIKIDKSIKP